MTLKEKVAEANPECVYEHYAGGVDGCPADYEYLNSNLKLFNCITLYNCCEDCWNQKFIHKRNPITWEKLWKRIGKQPTYKTQNRKVEVLIDGELRECALVFTESGANFHLEIVE